MKLKDAVYVYRLVGGDRLAWHGRYHAHNRGEYEFHVFLEGDGTFLCNRTKHRIEPRRVFITRPREFHSIVPQDVKKPISYYAFLFEGDPQSPHDKHALSVLGNRILRNRPFVAIEGRDHFLAEELYHLSRSSDESRNHAAEYLLLSLIYRWFGESPDTGQAHLSTSTVYIEGALKIMQREIKQKLSSREIAEHLGISEEHFIRLFKQALGMSPFQYFTRLKIEAAAGYLLQTRLHIQDISETFGFENPFHFSRVFKKCTGLSPQEYRLTYTQTIGEKSS
ncbi:MAG TPA: AraC family transcriptional regulator [Termitinemataceae bacterium]|jgi:AraC-like DNA-binding protein|uniref:AraC family transcriptional regulator n=1 Tax=Treponema sp. J25 TaxID=2094121 RepID=UPI00104B004D|nr:helix-turn-helix domain-containing protein [Treponema sp. J25]TCW61714.1 hypothetical protein C5O22_04830 [Treponema sp. J25]HOJ97984.1 AraC family transcriptional regulator [Termitinemataceae bacterium]HOM22231.1 AraC family transcriptional regulator [Termitinemataceae bacterium]HPP99347.1 AraC family transcriptional regulator [Termitinemataceae bacterium]